MTQSIPFSMDTLRSPRLVAHAAVTLLIALDGCSDDSGSPSGSDAAESICESADACGADVVQDECAMRIGARLAAAPEACESCLQSLSCQEWRSASTDLANVGTLCPICSQNQPRAMLTIELLWDAEPGDDTFVAGTCADGGVRTMEWRLIDSESGEIVMERSEPCANGIDVLYPESGEYELEITGLDANDETLWSATCGDLVVANAAAVYECEIPAP